MTDKPDQKTLVVNAIWNSTGRKLYSFELIRWGSNNYVNDPLRIARFISEIGDLAKYKLPGYRLNSRPLTSEEKAERHLVRTKQVYEIISVTPACEENGQYKLAI